MESAAALVHCPHQCMIQIIPGDRAGADNLAEIVDPIRNTVMAAGPDAQVDRHAIAPEDRMSVDVRRACIAHDIAGIVHSGSRGGEKSGRNRQLLDPGRAVGVRDVILPNGRLVRKIVQTGNEARIINRLGLACGRGLSFGHYAKGTRRIAVPTALLPTTWVKSLTP